MRKLTVLTVFVFLCSSGVTSFAGNVDRDSSILYAANRLKDAKGKTFAVERIYIGGGDDKTIHFEATGIKAFGLREIRGVVEQNNVITARPFKIQEGAKDVTLKVVPLFGGQDAEGNWHPVKGQWFFKYQGKNTYEAQVVLGSGTQLDIAYQDTRMSIGKETDVLHYGLSVAHTEAPKAVDYLRGLSSTGKGSITTRPTLGYRPPNDILIARFWVSKKGEIFFVPILEYSTRTQ